MTSLPHPSSVILTERHPGRVDLQGLHALDPGRYPFLLESSGGAQARTGRYDLLFAAEPRAPAPQDLPASLDADFAQHAVPRQADLAHLPFIGGWFVYLGYELAGRIEPRLKLPAARGLAAQWPRAFAARCRSAAIYDHGRAETWIVVEADHPRAPAELRRWREDIARVVAPAAAGELRLAELEEPAAGEFLHGVERTKEYILAGDVFQINLARKWRARLRHAYEPLEVYRALARANPAPFAALVRWGGLALISSSPERLFAVGDGEIETRPIAGTRPRGRLADAERKALVSHPKERAEHVMLLDLERNDLGRVCEAGSVRVDEFMIAESYAHVHHIVSNVRGKLRRGWTPAEVIRALFPGGTITGCPKVRSMEIIAELEGEGRGPYTGAVGYLDRRGRMDFNILIRSLWLEQDRLEFRTGAGIVADSIPARELSETRAKARGLLRALGSDA